LLDCSPVDEVPLEEPPLVRPVSPVGPLVPLMMLLCRFGAFFGFDVVLEDVALGGELRVAGWTRRGVAALL
jgi:hypothetical protein